MVRKYYSVCMYVPADSRSKSLAIRQQPLNTHPSPLVNGSDIDEVYLLHSIITS